MLLPTSQRDNAFTLAAFAGLVVAFASGWSLSLIEQAYPVLQPLPLVETSASTRALFAVAIVLFLLALPLTLSIVNPFKVLFALTVSAAIPLFSVVVWNLSNVAFDNRNPVQVQATIAGKREISQYKVHKHFLELSTAPNQEALELRVPFKQYQSATVGSRVILTVHRGFFGKSWVGHYDVVEI